MNRSFWIAVLLGTLGAQVAAEEPIATDRPDAVESSDVVGRMVMSHWA